MTREMDPTSVADNSAKRGLHHVFFDRTPEQLPPGGVHMAPGECCGFCGLDARNAVHDVDKARMHVFVASTIDGVQSQLCEVCGHPESNTYRHVNIVKAPPEAVDHPAHYGGDTPYEVIKVLEAWGLDASFTLANAVKYIARAGKKSGATTLEDLKKARWYIDRAISRLEPK